jgi:hypothetical protein
MSKQENTSLPAGGPGDAPPQYPQALQAQNPGNTNPQQPYSYGQYNSGAPQSQPYGAPPQQPFQQLGAYPPPPSSNFTPNGEPNQSKGSCYPVTNLGIICLHRASNGRLVGRWTSFECRLFWRSCSRRIYVWDPIPLPTEPGSEFCPRSISDEPEWSVWQRQCTNPR